MLLKKILPAVLSLISLSFYGQEPAQSSPFDFLENKDKMFDVPQSPEVAAFEKYGNLPVNFYAGAPEISIPVFSHKGKEISLPISLTYDATGIKVEQIATNVGLGWNLNFGGVVSRDVKHLPDDLYSIEHQDGGNYNHQKIYETQTRTLISTIVNEGISSIFNYYGEFNSQSTANLMSNLYGKYKEEKIDLLPDIFNFNVNGLSGKIFINYDNNTAYCISDPNIQVSFLTAYNGTERYISSWTITGTDGTSYTFEAIEFTKNFISDDNPSPWNDNFRQFIRTYASAWYITKIVSPNGFDTYDFFYSTPRYWEDNYRVRNDIHTVSLKKNINNNIYQVTPNFAYSSTYQIRQFHLDEIKYNQTTIFSTETSYRDDLVSDNNGEKMKRFTKFKSHNAFGNVVQNMELLHSYFKNQSNQTNSWENSRLKLDGILIYNTGITDPKKYEFDYIEPNSMPKITSNAVDFWGYYNGQNNNQHQIPKTFNLTTSSSFTFANRNPDFTYGKRGTLSQIKYPTGGVTNFHYEPHKGIAYTEYTVNGIVGGLRLFKQESETLDSYENNKITNLYYYEDANNLSNPANLPTTYTTSALVHQPLLFEKDQVVEISDPEPGQPETSSSLFQMAKNLFVTVPNVITYTKVSEIEYISGSHNGFTTYEFYNEHYDVPLVQELPLINDKPRNGQLKIKSIYDKNKDLLNETINTIVNEEGGNEAYSDGYGITFTDSSYPMGNKGCTRLNNNYFNIELFHVSCSNPGPYSGVPFNHFIIMRDNLNGFYWAKHESSIEKTFFQGNTTPLSTTTTKAYNSNRLVSEVTKTLSNGETITTNVYYPQDLVGQGEPDNGNLTTLKNRNSISSPVKVSNFKNGILTDTQRKYFIHHGTLPSKISASKANLPIEDKVIFHQYDNYGNPLRVSQVDAPQKYFIWGYNNQLMVGQIENWPDNPPQSALNKINEIISLSNNPSANINQFLTKFEELRNSLPQAMVTGFTHKPGVGISSITDAKGDTIFYHYDSNNRLEHVNDKNGNLLSENEYNYRVNN